MNELQKIFNYNGKQVRTVIVNGEPMFVAKDVCEILEIDPSQTRRLDDDEKGLCLTQTPGGEQEMLSVTESGLYSLVLGSRKAEAKVFKRWITHEVLPLIRKTGSYHMVPKTLPEALRLAADLAEKNESLMLETAQQKQVIGELRPKASYYDAILQNKGTVAITVIAKDYGMSGQSLNRLLHELGVQYLLGGTWLLYQQHADKGYTQSRTHIIDASRNVMQTYWTQKGRLFIYDLLKNKRGILPLIEQTEGPKSRFG